MAMRDLVVLCPDIRWEAVLESVLRRWQALGLPRPLNYQVHRPPGRTDGGVRALGPALLRSFEKTTRHALIVFDWHGCGDARSPSEIETSLRETLDVHWDGRAEVLVVKPDLEEWLLGASSHFGRVRQLRGISVRQVWADSGQWPRDASKPPETKALVERIFVRFQAKPSSANYRKIASAASLQLERCQSSSFHRFVTLLRSWFQ